MLKPAKHPRMLLSLLLTLALMLTGFTAVSAAAEPYAEKVTISIMEGTGVTPPVPDFIREELEKALNISIEISASTGGDDYSNQLNLMLAGGNPPDMFMIPNKQAIVQYARSGMLLDLTPYLDQLSEVHKLIGDDGFKKGTIDGKVYSIPKAPTIPNFSLWMREDWLKKLGLEPPKNVDELYEVLKKFTFDDPDGNGKQDTFGLTGDGLEYGFGSIWGAFGVGAPGEIYAVDGKLTASLHDPKFKDALAFIHKLIGEGLVDPDLMVNAGLKHQQKAIQGKAGAIYIDWANLKKDQFVAQIREINPDAEWIQLPTIEGPGGQHEFSVDLGGTPMFWGIPKSLENDSVKLQRVFALFNHVAGGDGANLVLYGLEGKHYNKEGETIVPTDLLAKEGGYFWIYQFVGRDDLPYLMTKFAAQASFIQFANDSPYLSKLNSFVIQPEGYNASEVKRFYEEEIVKFIYGKRPLSEYDAFVETLDKQFGYAEFLATAQEQLVALGYVK